MNNIKICLKNVVIKLDYAGCYNIYCFILQEWQNIISILMGKNLSNRKS